MDFEFDGLRLSDFGCMICDFNSGGDETVSAGSTITFTTTPLYYGAKFSLTGTKYEECLTATFDICKNPCQTDSHDFEYFTLAEEQEIMRWLNRKEFCEFRLWDSQYQGIHFNGSFNVNVVRWGQNIYGFELTLTTDRPFGVYDQSTYSFNFNQPNGTLTFTDLSDEIGYIYADMEITCLSAGDLIIRNSQEDRDILIKNCSQGEIISFHQPIIESSLNSHKIANDFNFNFPRISNTYLNRQNTFSFSLPCKGTISYEPIAKVGL